MTIRENENMLYNTICDALYNIPIDNNDIINEDSGHPLFKYGDSNETFDWIERIKYSMDVINDKIKTAKIKGKYKIDIFETGESFIYYEYLPISISLNKLGFKDVIDSRNSNLEIIIRDIVDGGTEFSEYVSIRNISSGSYTNTVTRKLLNGKYVNTSDKRNIMYAVCYSINGKIIPISFMRVFFHEYLHFYEHYNRFLYGDNSNHVHKYNDVVRWNKSIIHLDDFIFTKEEHKNIKYVLYHLYYGEDNAKIGELFSDLIHFDIKDLYDFNKHKNDILVFSIYDKLKNALSIIKKCDVDELGKYIKQFGFFIQPRKYINSHYTSIDNMTNERAAKLFIENITDKINKFYEKIMKFSGRFMYMQQQHQNQTVTSVKQ